MYPKVLAAAMVAVATLAVSPDRAAAAFQITLAETGFTSAVVSDHTGTTFTTPALQGAYYDSNGTTGSIRVSQVDSVSGPPGAQTYNAAATTTFGDFTIDIGGSRAESTSLSQVATSASTITNTSTVAKILTITVTDNTFFLPNSPGNFFTLQNNLTILSISGAGSTATTSLKADASASPPTTSAPQISTSTTGNSTVATASTTSVLWGRTSTPFTLTNTIQLTLAAGASISFQSNATVTPSSFVAPAPSGLILAAGALPFIGVLRRKFRAAPATAA